MSSAAPPPSEPGSAERRSGPLLALALLAAAAAWLICLPLVAVSPQPGDGAEFALSALRGTLLHPPGFPLFAALNDLLVWATATSAYAVVAAGAAVAHGLTVGALVLLAARLGVRPLVAFALALAYAFFPAALRTATDAEVFALHGLLATAVFWRAATLARAPSRRAFVMLGVACGLGGAHQPIIVFWAPWALTAVFVAGWRYRRARGLAGGFVWLVLGAGIGLLPYLTLFARQQAAPALAFGHLDSVHALVGHALRRDYGTLRVAKAAADTDTAMLGRFAVMTARALPAGFAALPVAGWLAWRRRDVILAGLLGAAAFHLLFLCILRFAEDGISHEVGERFFAAVAQSLTLVAAATLARLRLDRVAEIVAVAVLLLPVAAALPAALQAANAHGDAAADLFLREGLVEAPARAVWIGGSDVEEFGVPYVREELGTRDDLVPISSGRLSAKWYREERLPLLWPATGRMSLEARADLTSLLALAHKEQRAVVSGSSLDPPTGYVRRPLGVLWQWYRTGEQPENQAVVAGLLHYCARLPDGITDRNPQRARSIRLLNAFRVPLELAARISNEPIAKTALANAVAALERASPRAARVSCATALQALNME